MNIAVLSLTRDRLAYSKHCFATLQEKAGCKYDHWVLDNGSEDDTPDWLEEQGDFFVGYSDENLGLTPALNLLLDLCDPSQYDAQYDVIVRFDNDCEVIQPDTLRTVCEVAYEYEAIVAPRVLGLLNPPAIIGQVQAGEHVIEETAILGGIFMAIPASLFSEHGFRYDETMPTWTGDEAIVPWWRARGGTAGYLKGWAVNHYETTEGQRKRYPEYEQRKLAEMAS